MVILGGVIGKCETPTINISQENGHGILMITCQFVAYTTDKGIIGIPIKILLLPVFVDNVDKRLGYVYL